MARVEDCPFSSGCKYDGRVACQWKIAVNAALRLPTNNQRSDMLSEIDKSIEYNKCPLKKEFDMQSQQ